MSLDEECERKEELLNCFADLEESERERMIGVRKRKPNIKYEKMFRGVAEVTSIGVESIRMVRENGKKIKGFQVTPRIASLLRRGDKLGMTAGLSQGMWRLISFDIIGSEAGGGRIHLSVMNREEGRLPN